MISIQEIDKLTLAEKLELMEHLWARLSKNNPDYESPAWHAEELERRKQQELNGEITYIDWEEAKKQLFNLDK